MRKMILKSSFMTVLFIGLIAASCFCGEISIEDLVSQYNQATTLQKAQLMKHFKYSKMSVSGVVQNVDPWNVFNENKDIAAYYYKVTLAAKKTKDGVPYEVLVFYKNKDKAKAINRDEELKIEGDLLKIIDQRLIFSVWIYAEELTDFEKEMLGN